MRLFVIGHEDAVLGFSLAGVDGFVTEDPEAALQKLREVASRGDTGIVLITAGIAGRMGERLREMEQEYGLPIILEVPAPGEPLQRPPIRDLVRRALGVGPG